MNSLILLPKFVMLDSSALICLASDWAGANDRAGKQRADEFLDKLNSDSWTLFLTVHQIIELLGTNDSLVAQKRLQLIRQLPSVAWLQPVCEESAGTPGSALDILAYELDAIINRGASTLSEVVENVRSRLIGYGRGVDIAPKFIQNLNGCAELSKSISERAIEVASFDRAGDSQLQAMTLRECYQSPMRSRDEVQAGLNAAANHLERQLQAHGDKRLPKPAAAAKEFIRSTAATLESFPDGTLEGLTNYVCDTFKIPHDFATEDITIGELGELGVFAAQFRKVTPWIGLTHTAALKKDYPDLCPSWNFWKAIRKCQTRADRVEGGDLNDADLAVMVLYIQLVHVDKRTFEFLRQVEGKYPELASIMQQYTKGPYDRVFAQ